MKNQSSLYLYLILLFIILVIIYIYGKKSKNIYESFTNLYGINENYQNKKDDVNLSCKVGENNVYNCKPYMAKTKITTIHKNYPAVTFDKGIGPVSSSGIIKFNKKFDVVPYIFCNPILESKKSALSKDEADEIPLVNITVYNVTKQGFMYIKNKTESSGDDFNGIPKISEDNKTKFHWLAISDPPKNPTQKVNSTIQPSNV